MHGFWWIIVALVWVVLAADARADTVFLTNGEAVWGSDTYEEDNSVVVVRPSGNLTFPKSQVSRIERTRSSLPPFYSPPAATAAPGAERPAGSGAAPAAPGAPATQPAPSMPPGVPPTLAPPSGESATQLPPSPLPPPLPGTPR